MSVGKNLAMTGGIGALLMMLMKSGALEGLGGMLGGLFGSEEDKPTDVGVDDMSGSGGATPGSNVAMGDLMSVIAPSTAVETAPIESMAEARQQAMIEALMKKNSNDVALDRAGKIGSVNDFGGLY